MKKTIRYVLAIVLLGIATYILLCMPSTKVMITINDKEYEMQEITLQKFMKEGFNIQMGIDKANTGGFTNYAGVELKANTDYVSYLPMYASKGKGSSIQLGIYNSENKVVPIKKGKIKSIYCIIPELVEQGVSVEIKGLKLNGQTKEEIKKWMNQHLKGFQLDEVSNTNNFYYSSGKSSYSFVFNEENILASVTVGKEV